MGEVSKIQWTHATFNPWWGCARKSPGCEKCYAEAFSKRVGLKIWGVNSERRFFGEPHWREPIKWNRKAVQAGERWRVFCASMADVFEDRLDLVSQRKRLMGLILETPQLDWLLLTKRPENMVPMTKDYCGKKWPPNVWAGCTVEDQQRAEERIPILAQVPAAVRFLSCEPLLGPLNLFGPKLADTGPFGAAWIKKSYKTWTDYGDEWDVELTAAVDWTIVGGESGPGARPFDVAWARDIVDQCRGALVACFVKQLGTKPVDKFLSYPLRLRDRKGGDPSEWPGGPWPREFPGDVHP